MRNNEPGASIRYTTDGKNNPSNTYGTVYTGDWIVDTWPIMGVRAIAYKSGMKNSSVTGQTFYINTTTATPTLKKTDMPNGATIELDAEGNGETIYYTTDGSNPTFNVGAAKATNGKQYTGAFTLTQNTTVKAIAVRSGQLVSGVMSKDLEVVAPRTPQHVSTLNGSKPADAFAVDDAVTVRWDEDSSAASYTVTLYDSDGKAVDTVTAKAAQAVFAPSKAGVYSIGVKASNAVGASEESERVQIEAKAPCLVKFVDKVTDEQGNVSTNVLDKQLVRYGYSAETPAVPVKRGYTFAGWDKDTPLTNITQDGYEIVANWQIRNYTVRYYKSDGKSLLKTESVEFGKASTPPTPPAPESGYVFNGWTVVEADSDSARDYKKIDSNMSLKAVYAWGDQELPVSVTIRSAQRNERVYTVDVNVTNNPTTATTAILRVALKTSAGKLVQSSRETISLPAAGATNNHRVTLKYDDGGYVASIAEVEVLGFSGDYRTGGAYSKAVTARITSADDYTLSTDASEWTTERPSESDDYVIESEVQYRFKDRQETTSTATSLDGWARDDSKTTTTYGGWGSEQSTTTKPTASDTLSITGSSTAYNYYHWHSKYDNCMNQDSGWVNNTSVCHRITTGSPLSGPKYVFPDKGGKASQEYGPYGTCAWNPSKAYWWLENTVTTYRYKTRSKTVTYGYYKWGEWSDWSSEVATATDSREVEERTVYRTREKLYNDLTGTEDTSGKSYSVSGKFDSSMEVAGKEATIMVYNVTNSDPNEDQIQYIGQTTIGDDNSYAFDFIPKKEPSGDTGDFIVSLGVKGATSLVNVDKIEAPANEHTVIYMYKNAEGEDVKVSEQTVADGQAAEVPDPPVVEGEQFQRWSASTTSVTQDMTVSALYTSATYAVAWIDWVNGDVLLETKAYGDTLTPPMENPTANGYTFKGWDALLDGKNTVAGNTVVNAVYDPIKYTVIFSNANGSVMSKQEVAYGEAATLPQETPTCEGMEFVAWDTSAATPWWNVTEDMIVKPLFAYENTVTSPFSSAELAEGYVSAKGTKVFLESPTEGAKIYYTTDGSDPVEVTSLTGQSLGTQYLGVQEEGSDALVVTSKLYVESEGITVTEPTKIRAIAVKEEMNDSSIAEIDVDVTATNDIANADAGVSEAPFFFGEAVEPGVMVWLGNDLLAYGEDYTVEYSDNDAIGTATAVVKGIGDYVGTQTVTFDIVEPPSDVDEQSEAPGDPSDPEDGKTASLSAVTIAKIGSQTYTGKSLTPKPTVKLAGTTLKAGTDYAVSYKNNIDAGTATVTVTGKGSYTGSKSATFKIAPASIAGAELALSKASFTYSGKAQKPAVKTVGGKALKAGADYTVKYANAKSANAGTYAVTVTGKGNYSGTSAKATYKIAKAANPMKVKGKIAKVKAKKLKRSAVKLAAKKVVTVKKAQGKVSYKKVKGNKKITVAKKTGKVKVKKGLKKGTYKVKVKVTAKGNANYKKLAKTVTFKVKVK